MKKLTFEKCIGFNHLSLRNYWGFLVFKKGEYSGSFEQQITTTKLHQIIICKLAVRIFTRALLYSIRLRLRFVVVPPHPTIPLPHSTHLLFPGLEDIFLPSSTSSFFPPPSPSLFRVGHEKVCVIFSEPVWDYHLVNDSSTRPPAWVPWVPRRRPTHFLLHGPVFEEARRASPCLGMCHRTREES